MDRETPPQTEEPTPDTASRAAGWMIAMLWILMLGGGTLVAQRWLDKRDAPPAYQLTSTASGASAMTLNADRYGQYVVAGSANAQPVIFLLDTGASGISMPESVAQRLGLKRGQAFDVVTANGTVEVFATKLDSLTVGPFQREDVRASINPSMEGDVALLGMSFLRHFELLQRAEQLTISMP